MPPTQVSLGTTCLCALAPVVPALVIAYGSLTAGRARACTAGCLSAKGSRPSPARQQKE
jgi:hypothetical protein